MFIPLLLREKGSVAAAAVPCLLPQEKANYRRTRGPLPEGAFFVARFAT